jgi:hypothetical protein
MGSGAPSLEIGVGSMTRDTEDTDGKDEAKHLAFMLSQLRDDIDEIFSSLESGAIEYDMAVDATKTQLQWMLDRLAKRE